MGPPPVLVPPPELVPFGLGGGPEGGLIRGGMVCAEGAEAKKKKHNLMFQRVQGCSDPPNSNYNPDYLGTPQLINWDWVSFYMGKKFSTGVTGKKSEKVLKTENCELVTRRQLGG